MSGLWRLGRQINIIFLKLVSDLLVAVGPNLALDQPTIQSSTMVGSGYPYYSSYAVDGRLGFYGVYPFTCAMTNVEEQPWWAVDLFNVTSVLYVELNIRSDCCGTSV